MGEGWSENDRLVRTKIKMSIYVRPMVRNLYINLALLRLLEIPKMGVYTYINIGMYTYAYIDIYVGTIEGSPFKK